MVNQQQSLSIRQLAQAARVSVRTLHYYDQIGLLTPARQEGNNYRTYDNTAILRLQQILFYKEMGFELEKIKAILDNPNFDFLAALTQHRQAVQGKLEQMRTLLATIEKTIEQIKGNRTMTHSEYFNGISDEQQAAYEKEAAKKWGPEIVKESNRRYKALSTAERNQLMHNGERITLALRDAMGQGPASPAVQELVRQWQEYINFFYDCTPEILSGLGQMYVEDPRFRSFYEKIAPGLAEFFSEAIHIYCTKA